MRTRLADSLSKALSSVEGLLVRILNRIFYFPEGENSERLTITCWKFGGVFHFHTIDEKFKGQMPT